MSYTRTNDKQNGRIELIFKLMEYDVLTDWEDNFVASVANHFEQKSSLSIAQYDKLEEVFKRASER
jgi:hypothetical protein